MIWESHSDSPWEVKKPALQQYGLMALNTMLASEVTWDEARIRNRSSVLLGHALKIWPRCP